MKEEKIVGSVYAQKALRKSGASPVQQPFPCLAGAISRSNRHRANNVSGQLGGFDFKVFLCPEVEAFRKKVAVRFFVYPDNHSSGSKGSGGDFPDTFMLPAKSERSAPCLLYTSRCV